jgi:hypothetical protein
MQLAASPSNYLKVLVSIVTSIPSPDRIRLCTPSVLVRNVPCRIFGVASPKVASMGMFHCGAAKKWYLGGIVVVTAYSLGSWVWSIRVHIYI